MVFNLSLVVPVSTPVFKLVFHSIPSRFIFLYRPSRVIRVGTPDYFAMRASTTRGLHSAANLRGETT